MVGIYLFYAPMVCIYLCYAPMVGITLLPSPMVGITLLPSPHGELFPLPGCVQRGVIPSSRMCTTVGILPPPAHNGGYTPSRSNTTVVIPLPALTQR